MVSVPNHALTTRHSFLLPSRKLERFFLLLTEPANRCSLIFFHIHLCSLWAWHDLCSPSHLIITLFLRALTNISPLLCPSYLHLLLFFAPPRTHLPLAPCLSVSIPSSLPSLPPLRRALCPMGIRVAQQTTSATARRGKLMRRSSWQTMWGRFHSALKCLSNCKKVPSNSASSDKTGGVCVARGQQTFKSCSFFQSNWNSFTFCCAYFAAGVIVRDQIYQTLRGFVLVRDKCLLLSRSSELSTCSRPKIKTQACFWEDFTCPS